MPRARPTGLSAFLVALLSACGGAPGPEAPAEITIPLRAATAGERLLALAPAGADIVVEVDFARLRANAVIGPVVQRAGSAPLEPGSAEAIAALRALRDADAMLLCAYGVGTPRARTLTLFTGAAIVQQALGEAVTPEVRALGPRALVDEARALAGTQLAATDQVEGARSMADDRALLRVRALAMPQPASGASLRVAARLDFDARVALASAFGLDAVPTSVSVWGDVADDLAVVGLLGGTSASDAEAIARSTTGWGQRMTGDPLLRALGLAGVFRRLRVAREGEGVRAVLVVGPDRLADLVEDLGRKLDLVQEIRS